MHDQDKNLTIATFRFGIIADFVTGVKLSYGERERLLCEKTERIYKIPFSTGNRVARSTIEKWIWDYKQAGYRLDGLYPKPRKDKGSSRSLSTSLKLAIKEIKKESPKLTVPALITSLRHKKLIGADEKINLTSIYRYINQEQLTKVNENAVDKRHFEASHPNEIWQSDVMYGPHVMVDGKSRQSYLIGILDDHSRLAVHAEFYLAETKENFLDCLRQALLKRGLPSKLYIDNGSCYRTLHLEQVAALLGIAIHHSRPYTPQGRGKIERWFRYVQDNFIAVYKQANRQDKLDHLNNHFSDWVDEYNNRIHSTTKQTPIDRYRAGVECVRPAPAELLNYFRQIEFRRVKKDRTIKLMGSFFEVPVALIDRQVELRFHPEDLSQIEIFFQGKSYGFATVVNPHINAVIGRNWDRNKQKEKKAEALPSETATPTGKLFSSTRSSEGELL